MNDQQRLAEFLQQASTRTGLGRRQYDRLIRELGRHPVEEGFNEQGRLKVAFFDAKSYDIASFDRQTQQRFDIHYRRVALSPETAQLANGFKVVCVFVNDRCDEPTLKALADHGVECIALRCAGFNNVDLETCRELGISVVRVPAYSPHAVAEHTVGLMLMLNRHLHQAYMRNRTGYFVLDGLTGFDMEGKTVGVVGTGQIGRVVVRILLGFGCRVLCYDAHSNDELADDPNVSYADLPELFEGSDIITLHVPLYPETHYLVDEKAIDRMKDGVMLINTSRGGLVDTRALIEGLKSGKIRSAGLDVYEEEAGIFFHDLSDKVLDDDVLARLMSFNNVVITSHQAYLTEEALAKIAETTVKSFEEFRQGKRGAELTYHVSCDS